MRHLVLIFLFFVLLGCEAEEFSDGHPIKAMPELTDDFENFMSSEGIRYQVSGDTFTIENRYASSAIKQFIEQSGTDKIFLNADPSTELHYCCYINGHKRAYLEMLKGPNFWVELDEDIESTLREYTDYVFYDRDLISDVQLFDDLRLKVSLRAGTDGFTASKIRKEFFEEGGVHYLGQFELPDRPSDGKRQSFFMTKYLLDGVVRDYLKNLQVEIIVE